MAVLSALAAPQYRADWESINSRPNPQWFEDAKFGIFITWGLSSVPAWAPKERYSEWYWHDMQDKNGPAWKFHESVYGAKFQYQDFVPMLTAEMCNPAEWASLFRRAGAKYIIFVTKHHDGFCLWPDPYTWNWNSVDVGPHRDLTGELAGAVRAEGLRVGLYYSLYEWFNPLYKSDVDRYVDQYMLPQLKGLVEAYKPDLVWPDGEWDHPSATWRSTEFLAWLFNESSAPEDVAVNDRWGKECRDRNGGFATPEYGHISKGGHLIQKGLFEECQGMGRSFGYNRNESAENYRSTAELLELLIDTVSRGGNLALDVGPTADGRIPEIMQDRLLEMGQWLAVNGDAIYGTERWDRAPEMDRVRFTRKGSAVHAICLDWPGPELVLENTTGAAAVSARFIGVEQPLDARVDGKNIVVSIPALTPDKLPCRHAWVVKLELDRL
ncbi:MAG: alpha-L-fucosidase [Candidatus Hydrogenedentes bacterium]|nr:alpha-L-fucosidase [Candidatus Hydrogenedentota bacterium]